MRRVLAAVLLAVSLAGCASLPFTRGATLLADADRLAREGDWPGAVAAYDQYLARYPNAWAAPRALESRDTLAAMLAARAEVTRLRQEVARLRDELARREVDLARLRSDLERLKQIDLRLERTR